MTPEQVTNSLRVQLSLIWKNIEPYAPPLCIVDLTNTGISSFSAFVGSSDTYDIKLYDSNGRLVRRRTTDRTPEKERARWDSFRPHDVQQVTSFSIPQMFQVKTNERYSLAVAIRVSPWPDGGKTSYHGKHTYFLLPAVTNSFEIDLIPPTTESQTADSSAHFRSRALNVSEMTEQDKVQFMKNFTEKCKPAVDKWLRVYAGHTPFLSNEFTADAFQMRTGGTNVANFGYVFDLNGIRFVIYTVRGEVKICQMTTDASKKTIAFSEEHSGAETKFSVGRDEVVGLIQADIGRKVNPGDITIQPITGAPAFDAGTFVQLKRKESGESFNAGNDMELLFGSGGKLIYYMRHPSF